MQHDPAIHPFELTIGPGPYDFVGCDDKGGACAHCGRAIVYRCSVSNRDGKTFTVGNMCVEKINGPYLSASSAQVAVAKAQAEAKRLQAMRRAMSKVPKMQALIAKYGAQMNCLPSPVGRGETMLSYAKQFVLENEEGAIHPRGIEGAIGKIEMAAERLQWDFWAARKKQ